MQPNPDVIAPQLGEFQSSPVPEDGCNVVDASLPVRIESFNPHPSRRTGATGGGSGFIGPRTMFQSSPVPEDGCNPFADNHQVPAGVFQSSPVPEDGCNEMKMQALEDAALVSILTRPGGRVQRDGADGA